MADRRMAAHVPGAPESDRAVGDLYLRVRKVRNELRDAASAFYQATEYRALDPKDLSADDRISAEATIILLQQAEAMARELRERIPDPKERDKEPEHNQHMQSRPQDCNQRAKYGEPA